MPDLYPNSRRQIYKTSLKEIRSAIETNEEYGSGLSQLLDQYTSKKNQEDQSPGPAHYSPSLNQVTKKQPTTFFSTQFKKSTNESLDASIKDISKNQSISDSILTTKINSSSSTLPQIIGDKPSHLQILVSNGDAKVALIGDQENKVFERARLFAARAPRHGELKRAKISKNVFDLAKEDAFDPSPEASSIELFLLRQRQLGPSEIPPPGYYYQEDQVSGFNLKQASSKSVHFDSSSKRVMTFGKNQGSVQEKQTIDSDQLHADLMAQRKTKYYGALPKLPTDVMVSQETQYSDFPQEQKSQRSSQHFSQVIEKKSLERKRTHNSSIILSQPSNAGPTFPMSKKQSAFDLHFQAQLPGPGSYHQDIFTVKTATNPHGKGISFNNQDLYFGSVFGSGCKRFSENNLNIQK